MECIMRHPIPLLLLVCGLLAPALAQHKPGAPSTPGSFDFYLLSLSWSPQYCFEIGLDRNAPECDPARRLGFVAHGLWPENVNGLNPFHCAPAPPLDPQTAQSMLDLMPDKDLIVHEWGAHGACSGLAPAPYFGNLRAAFTRLKIPPQYQHLTKPTEVPVKTFRQSIVDANPGLKPEDFALYCDEKALREVRVCMNKDLSYRACGARIHDDGCGLEKLGLRSAR
jgi:ribonuclease T2